MTSAVLVAPRSRPVSFPGNARRPALLCLAAVVLTALAAAGLPQLRSPSATSTLGARAVTAISVENAAQRFTASFGHSGATVRADRARFILGLTSLGRGAHALPVTPVRPQMATGVISYYFPMGLTETWRNSSLGLEQTFVVSHRPAGTGPLVVHMPAPAGALRVPGAVLLPGGLTYSGLRATDASGRVLHSWLALAHGQLLIKVADRGARYPVRIDPLVHQADLTAKDGAIGDYMGASVAVSGKTLVAGAPYHKVGSNGGQGALYVFSDRAGHWTPTAELSVTGGAPSEYLGSAVAMSGNTIVASAPEAGTASQGALFVFSDVAGHWKQVAELTANDAAAGDHLGDYGVAIQGKTIVAGSPAHTVGSVSGQGAAYVWDEPAGGWHSMTQTAELTEAHGAVDDWVGWSVGISGTTIVAGSPAPYHYSNHHSAIFVFTEQSGHWKQTAELHQKDVATNDDIGQVVAISGHTIAAGSGGGDFYVFALAKGKWKQTADMGYEPACQSDSCPASTGSGLAFDGSAILSATSDATGHYNVGGIGEYRLISGHWRQVATVTAGASQQQTQEGLAPAIATSGDVVVIGLTNGLDKGSVTVFKGRVTSEGPLIGTIGSGGAGIVDVPVTCELPAHKTCVVKLSARRAGHKQVMGHAKPKSIRGTDIRTVVVHMNAAFNRLLSKPNGVKVKFTVHEYLRGKRKFSGSTTETFVAE